MVDGTPRIFIVHGWASSPDDAWLPWLARVLREEGHEVCVPAFPDPRHPDINVWARILGCVVGPLDARTYFVAHSLGCIVTFAYLQGLVGDVRAGGVVCVGGRIRREGRVLFDVETLRRRAGLIRAIFSDNDYHIPLEEKDVFESELGAETKVLHGRGHFSRLEGTTELPEALSALRDIMSRNE